MNTSLYSKKKKMSTGRIFDYLLVLFIVLWSGGGFTYGFFPRWMVAGFFIVGAVYIYRGFKLHSIQLLVFFILLFAIFLQAYKFNGSLISIIAPALTIATCLMSAEILKKDFNLVFLNIILFFALVSVVFWLINVIPSGRTVLINIANSLPQLGWDNLDSLESTSVNSVSLYLYSVLLDGNSLPRNMGPFWEPGRFTIYLTIAHAINLFHFKQSFFSAKSLILLVANITTFSTTGYLAMLVLIAAYSFFSDIKKYKKIILCILFIALVPYIFQLDFMSGKLQEQATDVDVTYSRFGAIYYHWQQIQKSPLIGYGPYLMKRYTFLEMSPNGLTDLIRYYGIPLSLLLYIMLYRSVKLMFSNGKLGISIFIYISILLLCFSQTITYSPFFYLLYFFSFKSTKNHVS